MLVGAKCLAHHMRPRHTTDSLFLPTCLQVPGHGEEEEGEQGWGDGEEGAGGREAEWVGDGEGGGGEGEEGEEDGAHSGSEEEEVSAMICLVFMFRAC